MSHMSDVDTVVVIGLGYIGLPTAAVLASSGVTVVGVDTDEKRVELINNGHAPFAEPNLENLVVGAVTTGRLSVQTTIPQADAYIVAVPTPLINEDADLTHVREAATALAPMLRGGTLVILESTSPPGTTEWLAEFLIERRPDLTLTEQQPNSLYVAYAPERVLPGRIMAEITDNDRIIGGVNERSGKLAEHLYSKFTRGALLVTNARTAEMTKLSENAFRDVNIAFANELSMMAHDLGVNVWDVIRLANRHPRVNILQPGPGVGGHCIAVDPWFLVGASPNGARLIRTARQVNDDKPEFVISQVVEKAEKLKTPIISVFGLAFKANVDDLRGSPSIAIVQDLATRMANAEILVVEPHIECLGLPLSGKSNVSLVEIDDALERSDIIVVLVEHDQFRVLYDADLQGKQIIDTKGLLERRPVQSNDG